MSLKNYEENKGERAEQAGVEISGDWHNLREQNKW